MNIKNFNVLPSLVVTVIVLSSFAAANVYKVPANSNANFTIDGMLGADVKGTLTFKDAKIDFDANNPAAAHMDVSLSVASIKTGITKRDNHLKTADFFDAAKYPLISFHSTAVSKQSGNSYQVTGALTIKNVTKTVTIPFTFTKNGNKAVFKGNFTIKRLDYKVGENEKFAVGKEVRISLNVPAIQQ